MNETLHVALGVYGPLIVLGLLLVVALVVKLFRRPPAPPSPPAPALPAEKLVCAMPLFSFGVKRWAARVNEGVATGYTLEHTDISNHGLRVVCLARLKKAAALLLLLALPMAVHAKPQEGGPVGPDGQTQVMADVPVELREHNVGGRDGAGLCVFTSIAHAARYQHELRLRSFQQDMKKEPGGGYPSKVDSMIDKYGKGTPYVQYEGRDDSVIRAALATGRLPCVTYDGHDCHYSGTIGHMVNCVYLDDRYGVILDNNFVGEDQLVWMTHDEFVSRWQGHGGGWAVVLLAPPPPPVPHASHLARGDRSRAFLDPDGLLWFPRDDCLYLKRGQTWLGAYRLGGHYWMPYHEGTWGAADPLPPVELPDGYTLNFGVQGLRLDNCYLVNGFPASKAEALDAIGADVPDDSRLNRLTLVGAPAATLVIQTDLDNNPALAPWKGKLVVQSYDPSDPLDVPLLKVGIPADGNPTVLIQSPSGKVLHHQRDYAGGAEGLALALRKADPLYDPSKDPDKRKPDLMPGLPSLEELGVSHDQAAAGGVLALILAGALALKGTKK